MTGNGTAGWIAVAALMGSLACSSTTARPAETGTAPSRGASDTNVAGGQGGTWDTTAHTRAAQDTSRTRAPSDTANTGRRIHTDSASVSAPSNQAPPNQTTSQTDTTGQYRYRDSTGASSTARDTTMGKSTTRDTSRTNSP
jgi:hypothetical protein